MDGNCLISDNNHDAKILHLVFELDIYRINDFKVQTELHTNSTFDYSPEMFRFCSNTTVPHAI